MTSVHSLPFTFNFYRKFEHAGQFDTKTCHQYVMDNFTSTQMTKAYLSKYETVLNGQHLNAQPPILKEIQSVKFLPFLP
jgi:hypothetical protein